MKGTSIGILENGVLKLNVSKTEYIAFGNPDSTTIHISTEPALKSEKFRYLGSVMYKSGGIDPGVHGQNKCCLGQMAEGHLAQFVVCDCRILPILKGLLDKSTIRFDLLSRTISARNSHGNEDTGNNVV